MVFFCAAYIYVRVAEDRMDLLRAAIIGPKGTPYHDGLFFFDVHIPPMYPSGPPVYIPKALACYYSFFIICYHVCILLKFLSLMGVTGGILPLWRTSD